MPSFVRRLARLVFAVWPERRRQRRALAELTPDQLKDIGLTRGQALDEADRPFWRF